MKEEFKSILVTGANGFIGKNLIRSLLDCGYNVIGMRRGKVDVELSRELNSKIMSGAYTEVVVDDYESESELQRYMKNIDCVIHLAAIAHVIPNKSILNKVDYNSINVNITKNIAKVSRDNKVKKFIFLSSIGVLGEGTYGVPFSENTKPEPKREYAISKYAAESELKKIENDEMSVLIIRPPIVYGEMVPGNFLRLLNLIKSNRILPFGSIKAKRDMLSVYNLADFIIHCISHNVCEDKVLLVKDGESVSFSDLLRVISMHMKKRLILLPVPQFIFFFLAKVVNKEYEIEKLTSSMLIDDSYFRERTGWNPKYSFDESIKKTVKWYLS